MGEELEEVLSKVHEAVKCLQGDKEINNSAREYLEQIREHSDWQTARYLAGEAIENPFCTDAAVLELQKTDATPKTTKDAAELFRITNSHSVKCLLERLYDSSTNQEVWRPAGKALGYTDDRMKFRELRI